MRKRGMSPVQAEQVRLNRGIDRGAKLRIVRVQKGLSQSELAKLAEIPIKTLQRYEQQREVDKANLARLCRLCEVLGCNIADIIEDEKLIELFIKVK